jgi:type IX secretion system PorP/SprF family membrane protein
MVVLYDHNAGKPRGDMDLNRTRLKKICFSKMYIYLSDLCTTRTHKITGKHLKSMKKTLTIIALALGSVSAFAQQDPQFSQYMHNKMFMNPGYAGMRQALCFSLIGRQQWAGFDGSPTSGVFSADVYLPPLRGGLGLNVMYDKLGFESNMRYDLAYSFHAPLAGGVLGIGIELGAFSKRIGPTGNDQWVATTNWQTDQSIPPQLTSTQFDLGFGLWYQRQNVWFGISATHLPASSFTGQSSSIFNPSTGQNETFSLKYQLARHYFVTGGINLFQGNTWEIRPSFLVKSDGTITSFDINATALYDQRFWFGLSYRLQDAIIPMIGFQLPNSKSTPDERPGSGLKIGFAYDYTTSNLKNYSNGSFELYLNYCIPLTVPVKRTGHGDTRIFD